MTTRFYSPIAPARENDNRASPLVCALTILGLSGSGWWISLTLALAACAR